MGKNKKKKANKKKNSGNQTKRHGQKVNPKKRRHSQSNSSLSRNNESHRQAQQEQTDSNPLENIPYLSYDKETSKASGTKRQKLQVESEQEGKSMADRSAGTFVFSGNNAHAPMSRWYQGETAEPTLQVLHISCYFQHRI